MNLNQRIDLFYARLTIGGAVLITLALAGWAVTN